MPSEVVKATAILCLTALECVALLTGQDGVFFLPVAGLVGYIAGLKTEQVTSFFNFSKK